jgi:hypothetical protein
VAISGFLSHSHPVIIANSVCGVGICFFFLLQFGRGKGGVEWDGRSILHDFFFPVRSSSCSAIPGEFFFPRSVFFLLFVFLRRKSCPACVEKKILMIVFLLFLFCIFFLPLLHFVTTVMKPNAPREGTGGRYLCVLVFSFFFVPFFCLDWLGAFGGVGYGLGGRIWMGWDGRKSGKGKGTWEDLGWGYKGRQMEKAN